MESEIEMSESIEEKMAPVQGYTPGIPWSMHLEAYDVYRKKYGAQQALIEGWCRGGFGTGELDEYIPGWREKLSEIGKLKAEIAKLRNAYNAVVGPLTDERDTWKARCEFSFRERDALAAELAKLQKQEPVMVYEGRCIIDCGDAGHQDVTMLKMITAGSKLYAAAGAELESTKTVDRAWSQFCGGIGRGPDAPYPGMIEAFEAHYGQAFTDKDWRNETGIWAAAWGYAVRQSSSPCKVEFHTDGAAHENTTSTP